MTIIFKSKVTADLLMLSKDAKEMMRYMGKEASEIGIVTIAFLPEAIRKLKEAINTTSAGEAKIVSAEKEDEEIEEAVTTAQRAFPLLEMLERSLEAKVPVVWGV